MSLFGPPNVEKLKAKRDFCGLFKLMLANRGELSRQARLALIQSGPEVLAPLASEIVDSKGPSFPLAEFVDIAACIGSAAVPELMAIAGSSSRAEYLAILAQGAISAPMSVAWLQSVAEFARGTSIVLSSLAAVLGRDPAAARAKIPLLVGLHGMYALAGCVGDRTWGRPSPAMRLALIQDGNVQGWEWMAGALCLLGDRSATATLISRLKSNDPYTRRAVALLLGLMGDPRAVAPLTETLQDSDPRVSKAASLALSVLAPSSSAQATESRG